MKNEHLVKMVAATTGKVFLPICGPFGAELKPAKRDHVIAVLNRDSSDLMWNANIRGDDLYLTC